MKKGTRLLLLICACSLCFLVGVFIGRNMDTGYVPMPTNIQNAVSTEPVQTEVQDFRININSASKVQLMDLPGIGEQLAERIIEYRNTNGPFESTDALMDIDGIGAKKLQAIEEYIKVG